MEPQRARLELVLGLTAGTIHLKLTAICRLADDAAYAENATVCFWQFEALPGTFTPLSITYFKPYTSSSPRGLVTVFRSWAVEMYTFPLATIGELNLIPYPGVSPGFLLLS